METFPRPMIVCLCGSTRFYDAFQKANYEETMAGKIVLTVGFYPHSTEQAHGESIGITPEQKQELDQLHFRKIEMADEVLILNVGGYIGESTRRELAHARNLGKQVRFLEPETHTVVVHVNGQKVSEMELPNVSPGESLRFIEDGIHCVALHGIRRVTLVWTGINHSQIEIGYTHGADAVLKYDYNTEKQRNAMMAAIRAALNSTLVAVPA